MSNIINFEESLKRKSLERPSNVFFESFNRFHEAKMTGALRNDELSKLIILEGDFVANMISQGKFSEEEIDSIESYITGFAGPNRSNYFSIRHEDLDKASKTFLEGDYVALENLDKRNALATPVMEEEDYGKSFRKIA